MLRQHTPMGFTLNINGKLLSLDYPLIMGILNVTPDSFFSESRCSNDKKIITERARTIIGQGATIIDVGAYSSRPGATHISTEEEWVRLDTALSAIRQIYPDAIVSVDTFRADIARKCIKQYNVQIINDISGGSLDNKMYETIADLHIPYILTHMRGTPQTMQKNVAYNDIMADIIEYFSKRIAHLHLMGISDIILDPGFGFGKTLDDNYLLMHRMNELQILNLPLLTGISRKSMIYNLLETTPETSLNGTTSLNTIALLQGANILRVHDVKEAVETVKIVTKTITS